MSKRFSFIVINNKIHWEKWQNGAHQPTGGLLRILSLDHLSLPVFPLVESLPLKVLISLVPNYCHHLRLPVQTLKSGSESQPYQLSPLKSNTIPVYKLASMGTIYDSTPDTLVCISTLTIGLWFFPLANVLMQIWGCSLFRRYRD